jgi:hypothetical protein
MSEAQASTTAPRKKVPAAAFIGIAVAIGTSLIVIFAGGGKAKEPPPMELGPDMAAVLSLPG